MVFIRRVRTASGATAVQLAQYANGRQRIVTHVGSAHSQAELGVLMAQARALLEDPGQGELDLGVEPTPLVTPVLGPPPQPALLAPASVVPVRASVARVLSTDTRTLFDALADVYAGLGLDVLGDEVFRDLVLARVVEPTSLLDGARVLSDLGRRPASYATMKRTLARCGARGYRQQVATACFTRALTSGDISLVLYDCTTLYFEAEHEDDLRKVGYSKERRVDPQVVVGLLVDRHGFPLEVGCFEGNRAETTTIVPIVKEFAQRHQLEKIVVVADAGMLSAKNLAELDEANLRFIVGSKATKAPHDLASHFRWHGDAFTDGQVIDTLTPRTGKNTDNDPAKRAEPVWDQDLHPGSWRAVWAYSGRRAAHDAKTLTAQEHRARAVIAGEKAARTPRFVKVDGGAKTLDEKALARAHAVEGLKGYVTNIPAELMPAPEVIASYHELWHVEQSFRMSKSDLRARPMFHHTKDAIEAHLTIVFTALALARAAQDATGLAIRNLVRQLRTLRSATIKINGAVQTLAPEITSAQQALLDALHRVASSSPASHHAARAAEPEVTH